jgi:hypothetical protein
MLKLAMPLSEKAFPAATEIIKEITEKNAIDSMTMNITHAVHRDC